MVDVLDVRVDVAVGVLVLVADGVRVDVAVSLGVCVDVAVRVGVGAGKRQIPPYPFE